MNQKLKQIELWENEKSVRLRKATVIEVWKQLSIIQKIYARQQFGTPATAWYAEYPFYFQGSYKKRLHWYELTVKNVKYELPEQNRY